MHNEKIAEVVRIIGTLEKKFQSMAEKDGTLTKKLDETIVRTQQVIIQKNNHEILEIA